MKYANLTLGRIEAVVNKLGGEEEVERFLRGEFEMVAKAVKTLVPDVWRKFELRPWMSVEEVMSAFQSEGMNLGDRAAAVLGNSFLGERCEHRGEFVRLKARELGLRSPRMYDLLAAGQKQGLTPCKPKDSVALRLGCPDQPKQDVFWLAMEPVHVADGSGHWGLLYVVRDQYDESLRLDASWDFLHYFDAEDEFVFRKWSLRP